METKVNANEQVAEIAELIVTIRHREKYQEHDDKRILQDPVADVTGSN